MFVVTLRAIEITESKKISKPPLAAILICTLLVFGIVSGIKGDLLSWADQNKNANNSSKIQDPITLSNGKILSLAFSLDPSLLSTAKQKVKNGNDDPILQNSIQELLFQADSFISLRPTSVLEKNEIPPSGNKHDFMSLAPYRWPDPTKPTGLPYVGYDGRVNPEVYTITDKKNMEDMIYRVKILALAYYFTDNPKYASRAEEILRVWFLNNSSYMNPNLQYAEVIRGENNGTTRGILHGKYLPDVIEAIRLIRNSPQWSKEDQQGMELWFTKYLDWLINSEHGQEERRQRDNHGTWYRVQVLAIALFLNKTEVAKSSLLDLGDKFILQNIESDGSQSREIHRKNSLDYSTFNLLGLFKLASLGEHFGIDLWKYRTPEGVGLQKALDYILPSLLNKETWPYPQFKQIDRKNMVDLLCRAATHYQNSQLYRQACNSASKNDINITLSFPP
jgi:Alginate lyase